MFHAGMVDNWYYDNAHLFRERRVVLSLAAQLAAAAAVGAAISQPCSGWCAGSSHGSQAARPQGTIDIDITLGVDAQCRTLVDAENRAQLRVE
jgi:hypothetical protein